MKAAIYSRVSTEDQDFSKQTNELKDYAKKENIEVVYIFEEKESGFNKDRPEFEKVTVVPGTVPGRIQEKGREKK